MEETGTGGLSEMMENLSEGKVHYCFIRFNVNEVYKFVYISWCGEGVAGLRKGSFTSHAVDMGKLLHVRNLTLEMSGVCSAQLVEVVVVGMSVANVRLTAS